MKAKPLLDLEYLKNCFVIDSSIPEGLGWTSNMSRFANKKQGVYVKIVITILD